jgi:hypothetical protein
MFSKENIAKMATTLVLVIGGVVIANKYVMPMLTKKAPAATK